MLLFYSVPATAALRAGSSSGARSTAELQSPQGLLCPLNLSSHFAVLFLASFTPEHVSMLSYEESLKRLILSLFSLNTNQTQLNSIRCEGWENFIQTSLTRTTLEWKLIGLFRVLSAVHAGTICTWLLLCRTPAPCCRSCAWIKNKLLYEVALTLSWCCLLSPRQPSE